MELNLNRPIVFLDLETTGIKVATDRIVELCLLRVNPDGSKKIKTMRINPGIPIPAESSEIHGIRDEDVKDCPRFAQVAHELIEFMEGSDIAGYNSNHFDIPLIVEEFLRAGLDLELKGRRFVDIQNIFHKMEPRTLSAAYKFYCKKDLEMAHSAEADTVATYEILKAQLDRYSETEFKDKKGVITKPVVNDIKALSDFSFSNRAADLIGHVIYNDKNAEVFNFGKHKGKAVSDVFRDEPSYYDWIMKSEFPLSTKKVVTAIKLRGFNKESVKTQLF
ncbi:MAG: exonuclease domain-containing protein [Bacteroidales bacterium]